MDYFNDNIIKWALIIFATAAVSFLIQFVAQRFTAFPRSAGNGLYLVLLPVGFSLAGSPLIPWVGAFWTMVGLFEIIWSLRRSRVQLIS